MTAFVLPNPKQQYFTAAGLPLVGGKVYTYAVGTSTPKATYADSAQVSQNANPVVLNSRGEALIYWDGFYRVEVRDFLNNLIYAVDNYGDPSQDFIKSLGSPSNGSGADLVANADRSIANIPSLRAYPKPNLVSGRTLVVTLLEHGSGTGVGGGQFRWDAANTDADNNGTIINPTGNAGSGRWVRLIEDPSGQDFGIVGDGSDELTKAQNYLDWCEDNNRIANFGNLKVTISGPLTASNTAIVFDLPGFQAGAENPGFYPTGSGYTALTVSGVVSDFCVSVLGTGNAVHGVDFGSVSPATFLALSTIRYVRCANLAGRGVREVAPQNSSFGQISIEFCGTATDYAWSCVDNPSFSFVTAECTHTKIEPEQCVKSIMYVSPNTLACVFEKIHSERAAVDFATQPVAWDFGGGSCSYDQIRVTTSKDPAMDGIGVAVFRGEHVSYGNIRGEEGAGSMLNVQMRVNGGTALFENLSADLLTVGAGHNSPCTYINCDVETAGMIDLAGTRWIAGSIGTLNLSQSGGAATLSTARRVVFDGVDIGAIATVGIPGATLRACTLNSISTGGTFVYEDLVTDGAISLGLQTWEARHCRFNGNLTLDMTSGKGRLFDCDIAGNLIKASTFSALVNVNSRVVGTVDAVFNAAPAAGTFTIGERHYRVTPVGGSPKSWVCTASGSPGVWNSEGNL